MKRLAFGLVACFASSGCGDEPHGASEQAAATTGSSVGGGGEGVGGGGGSGGSATGGAGGTVGPLGNVIEVCDDPSGACIVPIYPVTDPTTNVRAVGFVATATGFEAVDEAGAVVWSSDVGAGAPFGGFDFDADGWPDLGLARSEPNGKICGSTPELSTWIDFVEGRAGALHQPVAPLDSICWTFPSATYPTHQWSDLGVLFGAGTTSMTLVPYYATTGWFFSFGGGAFSSIGSFHYPSTPAYDSTYTADQLDAHGIGTSHLPNSHVANGMVLLHDGEERAVFFTSGRVVQYELGPGDPYARQLVADTPFLTGGRTDIVGRNYGIVLRDPSEPDHIVLVSGTSADTVFSDMLSATMAADEWGQIERHVTVYDLRTTLVDDRYFSYAHDAMDGYKYEGRVVYPNQPLVPRDAAGPSRIAFNVYEGGHWRLHVTEPGSTVDATVFDDLFLWDIADVDQDGAVEWILSPSRDPEEPNVPGYYFVKWRTRFARWDDATLSLDVFREEQDVIPWLRGTFRRPEVTTSRSALYPALTVAADGSLSMLFASSSAQLEKRQL